MDGMQQPGRTGWARGGVCWFYKCTHVSPVRGRKAGGDNGVLCLLIMTATISERARSVTAWCLSAAARAEMSLSGLGCFDEN